MMAYRREIDGLRAVAVLPVIFFHAGFQSFSGGYVGVDVFFVISGYLITSLIVTEREDGTFSLLRFYERRARRILPALFCVMLFCLPFAWLWMMPDQLRDFAQSLLAVSLFGSNILFWRESGYFDALTDEKPLLHTWSLAVEEQYYIVFPVLLVAVWRLGRRAVVITISLLAVGSLFLSEWGWPGDAGARFYLAQTRAWEILIGALTAYYLLVHDQPSGRYGQAGAAAGLLLILYAIFAFDSSTPFPGLHALVPTTGTMLLILCLRPETALGRVLTFRPLVGIGLISYSAYLWHQPLFAFARLRSLEAPGDGLYLALSALAIGIAYLSWRFIENPARDRRRVPRRRIFAGAALGGTIFVSIGVFGHLTEGMPSRLGTYDPVASEYGGTGAHVSPEGRKYGLLAAEPAFIIYGDSHALQYIPELERWAQRDGFAFVAVTEAACLSLPGVTNWYTEERRSSCIEMVDVLRRYLDRYHVPVVFAHRWDKRLATPSYQKLNLGFEGKGIEMVFGALEKLRKEYPNHENPWLLVGNVPTSNLIEEGGYLRCRFKGYPQCPEQFPIAQGELYSAIRPFQQFAEQQKGFIFIDPYNALCDESVCFVKIQNKLVYSDHAHLSRFGARLVIERYASELPAPKRNTDVTRSSGGPRSANLRSGEDGLMRIDDHFPGDAERRVGIERNSLAEWQ